MLPKERKRGAYEAFFERELPVLLEDRARKAAAREAGVLEVGSRDVVLGTDLSADGESWLAFADERRVRKSKIGRGENGRTGKGGEGRTHPRWKKSTIHPQPVQQ